jgi:hypothetical protein
MTGNVADALTAAGPTFNRAGNWRLVGRAMFGRTSPGVVWREIDSGVIEVWRLNDAMTLDSSLAFAAPPDWELSALGDVNGDGVADFIWTNPLFEIGFFWLMNSLDGVETMAAHLSGYLVVPPGGDGARGATRTSRTEPRKGRGPTLLVDDATNVLTATAVASPIEHGIGDHVGGIAHA